MTLSTSCKHITRDAYAAILLNCITETMAIVQKQRNTDAETQVIFALPSPISQRSRL